MAELRYSIEQPDPQTEATLAFVFESLGISAEAGAPPSLWDGPHLVYGGGAEVRPNGIAIPRQPADLVWDELLAGALDPAALAGRLPFDLIGAVGRFLADDVPHDRGPAGLDHHGRLTFAASVPARAGLGDRPIVNEYVAFLGRLLRERLGVSGRPRWPAGRVAAIGLSHDVDLPDRYAFLAHSVRPWRLRRSPRTYLRTMLRLAAQRTHDRHPHDDWLFEPVMASEAKLGFRSTFFFAAVPFHSSVGAPEDVAYDIAQPRFRRAFRSIEEAGFEVGLHASYRAHQDAARFAAERSRLAALASSPIAGVRHHYWQLGPDPAATLRAHEQAGFGYDSSIAFNDHVGFRRSVALPFRPFDPVLGRPLHTVQLPTFCMDGNLFYESNDIDAGVRAVDGLVERIAATGGMGSIDWHIQTSHPVNRAFRSWGVAYQEILGQLAARSDLWVTSLGEIADWVGAGPARLANAA